MKLVLFTSDAIYTTVLPRKCAGQFWIHDKTNAGSIISLVAIEGTQGENPHSDGNWVIKSNASYTLLDSYGSPVSSACLEPLKLFTISHANKKKHYKLFVEPLSDDRKCYQPYIVKKEFTSLTIGRTIDCDIQYDCNMLTKKHAILSWEANKIVVKDNNSTNGTYVNGRAVKQYSLHNGDILYLMGLQIVVVQSYLYINNPDEKVTIHTANLEKIHVPIYIPGNRTVEDTDPTNIENDYYYRAPRFKYDVDTLELKLDPPPAPPAEDTMPWLLSIGPSVTMGMASATTATYSVINALNNGNISSAIPSLAMGVGMLAGTLIWPTITKSFHKKHRAKTEATRQTAYLNYLEELRSLVNRELHNQEIVLKENDQGISSYQERLTGDTPHVWERTHKHTDFLKLRLGTGRIPMYADIQYPERRFMVAKDPLLEQMYLFAEEKRWLNNVPICLSLTSQFISGIYGDHSALINYAKNLILQITVLHCYDEVKLVILYDESDEEEMSFVRWLPHTMDNQRRVRYLATSNEEVKILSSDLEPIIEYRSTHCAEELQDELPYYVVLCLDKKLSSRAEFLRSLVNQKENIRFPVICMYDRLKDLPKECHAVIHLDLSTISTLTTLGAVCAPAVEFHAEQFSPQNMIQLSRVLANLQVDTGISKFQLPKKYTFLEMLDVGMVEHINLLEKWTTNNPVKSLAAPIGIDRYGEPFMLDLHERAHGPHGLIAGMTGSGKSETIISYILSMAVNFSPQEVAFILIDYKGGGMAKAFEKLPHTAGIITNLDGSAINRSLVSMQSELHRRERIFQNVSDQYNISNIDIYKYQNLFREGKVNDPLPHLLIISDEFAELKKDQSDFMAALTSTARVGRSLGVHLILATQKPGGVVDDQIRSNSRFRLCLKVQDKGDSSEMLGRPEAAYLVDTGRFYLQVGNNEIFELGQSAWAGANYYPSPRVLKDLDDAISVVDTNGRTIAEVNADRYAGYKNARKQLDILCEYICNISIKENISRWKMWMDPIPQKIYVDELDKKYAIQKKRGVLEPTVGELDDPTHQRQDILRVPLTSGGNTIIYGSAGSGKSNFIEAMVYSLTNSHYPEDVNLYILDFGTEMMTSFSKAPHVGDVVLSHESEKVGNLFKLLQGCIIRRKKLLSTTGLSLEQHNEQSNHTEPSIVVFINNYASFTELYDNLIPEINFLTREGTKYGIYFVLSCSGVNNVRFSMLQNFRNIYCLQMNNTADYATVIGKTGSLQLEKCLGRGMVRVDKDTVLEFQTAFPFEGNNYYELIRNYCADLCTKYPGQHAQSIPVLPEEVSVEFLSRHVRLEKPLYVPVGVQKESLEVAYLDVTSRPVHLALSTGQEWKPFTEALAELLSKTLKINVHLISPSGSPENINENPLLHVYSDHASCEKVVHFVFSQMLQRNNSYKEALAENRAVPIFEPMFVIVQSMAQLKALLGTQISVSAETSDDTPLNRLQVAIEKSAKEYAIYFVIAEGIQALTPFTAEKWYKVQVDPNNGFWLGNGISSQYRLNVSIKPQGFSGAIPKNYGYQIIDGSAVLVKFLQ